MTAKDEPTEPANNPDEDQETPDPDHVDGDNALGAYLRGQRQLANLSLRQLSTMTEVSNAYLSQIERGLHEPSMRVLKRVGDALGLSTETLLSAAGVIPDGDEDAADAPPLPVEAAILADQLLTDAEKQALLSVYHSYREAKT